MDPSSSNRQISIRVNDAQLARAHQLSLLANQLPAHETAAALIIRAVHDGAVNPAATGIALANDALLASILKDAVVYRFGSGATPESDFVQLTAAQGPELVMQALDRLAAAFQEKRSMLAAGLFQLQRQLQDQEPSDEQSQKLAILNESFTGINASYVLVLSAAHALLDKSEDYRSKLAPTFRSFLAQDPYLLGLESHFNSLHGARSEDARRAALKEFFEVFCEQAVEPTLYDEHFSAIVQAILLRELRHVIEVDQKLAVEQRELAPYLANLFENRVRQELAIAIAASEEPQPVIQALRRCPPEAKRLMDCMLNYLMESSDSRNKKLTINAENIIACEVMLSIGCLLPETGIAKRLVGLLQRVDDLNPALILAFCSSLKFARLVEAQPSGMLANFIVEKCLSIVVELNEDQRSRLFNEVLLPFADEFVALVSNQPKFWQTLPEELRIRCIDSILLPRINELLLDNNIIDVSRDKSIAQLLFIHIAEKPAVKVNLNILVIKWLLQQANAEQLSSVQMTRLAEIFIKQPELKNKLGMTDVDLENFYTSGGLPVLQLMTSMPNCRSIFAKLTSKFQADQTNIEVLLSIATKFLLLPLKKALVEYDNLVTAKQNAELQYMHAVDSASQKAGAMDSLLRSERHVSALREMLENDASYIKVELELREKELDLKRYEGHVEKLKKLTTREKVEQNKEYTEASFQEKLRDYQRQIRALKAERFKIPDPRPAGLEDYSESYITVRDLELLEQSIAKRADTLAPVSNNTTSAASNLSQFTQDIELAKRQVNELFELVNLAFSTNLVARIKPSSIDIVPSGAGAILGLFCKTALVVKHISTLSESSAKIKARELEKEMRATLEMAFKSFTNIDDTNRILDQLAILSLTGSAILKEWPEAEGTEDTSTEYTITNIPVGVSLAEYLYQRLRADVDQNQKTITWLSGDSGWDESFHQPLLLMFSAMLVRKDLGQAEKKRALKAIASAVPYWIGKYTKTGSNLSTEAGATEALTNPCNLSVSLNALIRPWSRALAISKGITSNQRVAATILPTTEIMVNVALVMLKKADQAALASVYLPLWQHIRAATEEPRSQLFNQKELIRELGLGIRAKQNDLAEQKRLQEIAVAQALESAAPQPAKIEGLDFKDMANAGHLALPAPNTNLRLGAAHQFRLTDQTKPDEPNS